MVQGIPRPTLPLLPRGSSFATAWAFLGTPCLLDPWQMMYHPQVSVIISWPDEDLLSYLCNLEVNRGLSPGRRVCGGPREGKLGWEPIQAST